VRPDSVLVPTRLAGFMLKQLCTEFAYSEFCCLDSVILDPDSWSRLKELTSEIEATNDPVGRMRLRCTRLDAFFDYLTRGEERWIVECRRRELAAEWQQALI